MKTKYAKNMGISFNIIFFLLINTIQKFVYNVNNVIIITVNLSILDTI